MIQQPSPEPSIFDKANAAAQESLTSIVELARRTQTPIILYRDGQIVRLSADELQQQDATAGKAQEDKASNDDA